MSEKIRIAYIIDKIEIGGTEKQLIETIRRLDISKFHPTIVCLRPSRYFDELQINCEKRVLHVYSLISLDGLLKLTKFVAYLKSRKIDIIQTYFFDSTVFGVLAGKLARVKKIIVSRRDMGFWYTPTLLRVLRLTNRFVDRFLVNSNAVKKHLSQMEKVPLHKIDVIYNGIDPPRAYDKAMLQSLRCQLGIGSDDRVIGMVANLNRPVKRVDIFIKAAALVLKKIQNAKFLIVGDGHLKKELEQLSKSLGIHERIIFAGKQRDVWPYVSIFDIGVLCSDSEGLSNSLLEYAMMGVPSVATDSEGNREVARLLGNRAIHLVPRREFNGLARGILTVLDHDDKGPFAAKAPREEAVKWFSWQSIIRLTEAYYEAILSNKQAVANFISSNSKAT